MTHYAGEQIRASHFFDMISFTPTIANYGSATFTTHVWLSRGRWPLPGSPCSTRTRNSR